jgi:uncharacterized repeat protein (TIGR02543 family)
MKKFVLVLLTFTGLLVSCPDPGSSSQGNNPVNPINPDQKTLVVFDNTYGVCTAIVYDDYRRRSEDKIAEVPAGQRSREFERMPSVSEPFYFAYLISLNGIGDFTLNYVPKNGKDQKAVRIDANAKTTVLIPKLDETFLFANQLLSSNTSLLLNNNSFHSFELHRGASSLIPDNVSGSPVVNSWERAYYTINTSDPFDQSAGTVSNYHLLAGADYEAFPASPARFEPGHFYSYTYNGTISLDSDIPINFDNVVIKTYTITFNTNGGNGTVPAAQTVNAGSVITLPNGNGLTKTGYTFGGWNVNASGTEINYSAGASYLATGDITLYAKWFPLGTVTFTVNFNSNGGNAIASQHTASGFTAFRPTDPVRTEYSFAGWYGDPGLTAVYDFSRPVTGNITLYAKWDTVLYTVTFNANGAIGPVPAPQTVSTVSAITLPNGNGLSKEGYTFGGWSTDDSGAGDAYNAGASYTVAGDITLFAKWNAVRSAVVPVITVHPAGNVYILNDSASPMMVQASASDGGTLAYQWYSNSDNANSGGTAIAGATGASYTPPTNVAGTVYYYVIVSNNGVTAVSNAAGITVDISGELCTVTFNDIQGVTAPVTGIAPVTTITENEQYSGTVTWSPDHSTFDILTVYTATIMLSPKTGYTLQGVTADFFTVAGAATVNNDSDSGVVTAVFRAILYGTDNTGPGGGKVFYYNAAGFTMTDNNQVCHYLEAAPADIRDLLWASPGYTSTDISGTETAIGTGRKNTALILARDANAPAAKACRDYRGPNNLTDWFLPSKDELNEMYINRVYVVNITTSRYWSSSQENNAGAWLQYFFPSGEDAGFQETVGKGSFPYLQSGYVLAIRAF